MATIFLTARDDTRTIINPGTYTIDSLGGVDTLSFGTSLRSAYTITLGGDGGVQVDTVSGASAAFRATLYNTEVLLFDSERDRIDLGTFFAGASTTLTGTAADDRLTPGATVTSVDGRAGIDTVALAKGRSTYQLKSTDTGFSLAPLDGSKPLALSSVERLQFSDQKVALDLDGHAGLVARILGAVFGPESVTNAGYVGIGLGHADAGLGAEALMQLALDARLGPGATPTAVVSLLYTNVVGSAPSAADLAFYTGLLDDKTHTPASLGVMAADTTLNQANIDLVGLASVGLAFS